MKHSKFNIQNSKLASLLLALLLFGACQPTDRERQRDITYTIAKEQPATVHLASEAEFQTLLSNFCDWAEAGSEVTFYNPSRIPSSKSQNPNPKEATTCSTTSREEIKRWMAQMEDAGLTVTVTYDPATGTWNGTAYANAPQPRRGVATFVNLSDDGYQGPTVVVTIDSLNRTAYVSFDNEHYTQWHLPVGKFENIWQYDDNILVLYAEGGDTLGFSPLVGDTMILRYLPAEPCWPQHQHYFTVARVREGCQTWYSDQAGGIVMNVWPNIIETYPEGSLALICAPQVPYLNCISPLFTGSCELLRYYTDRAGVDWELSLHYQGHDGTTQYISDSLGVTNFLGHNSSTDCMVIHDLHRNPGCASRYVFAQVN